MKYNWINKKWVKVTAHVLVWLIVFSLPYLLSSHYENIRKDPDSDNFFILNSLTGILWIIVFYLNAYFLVPRYIYSKKYLYFGLYIVGIFCVIMLIHLFLFALF